MLEKRWIVADQPSKEKILKLSESINVSEELSAILIQRGVEDFDKARDFFRPSLDKLHDPFLMKDMDKAVSRISDAIENKEKILIYGDYDVDGTTSVALVFGFLSRYYTNLLFYIPDRYKEGYGVSEAGIKYAKDQQVGLIISLDCGIKAFNRVSDAKEAGIDFIICDHHNPDMSSLPPAHAILDPKRTDCEYPYKELSGCGVGFKLMQAYCISNDIDAKELFPYLDLLAISIASDIVPITGENRILAYWGLKVLNKNPRPGVRGLINISGLKNEIDITSVVFGIGPRINAAGRIEHAGNAVRLLLETDEDDIMEFSSRINSNNSDRRDFDASITREAIEMIQSDGYINTKSTVLYKPDWHKGVIGIVASRCIEQYYKPTIILTRSNGLATGSARSIEGFDLYEAIGQCADLLEQFGGHTHAAGLTLKESNIETFRKRFEEIAEANLKDEDLKPVQYIDQSLQFDKIDYKFYNILKQMGPFGPGNLSPVFISENVTDTGQVRLLKDKHLKLKLIQKDNTMVYEAIAFNFGEFFEIIKKGETFDVCYSLEENVYNGRSSLQLNIKDIKFRNE